MNQIFNCFKNKTSNVKKTGHNYVNSIKLFEGDGGAFLLDWPTTHSAVRAPDEVIKCPIVPRLSVVISYTFTI